MVNNQYGRFFRLLKYPLLFACLLLSTAGSGQRAKADSIIRLLKAVQEDTAKIRLMRDLAASISVYNPDTALTISYEALSLARSINDVDGESLSLGALASTFRKIGNYTRALEFSIQKLKLEEKRNKPRNLASVLITIGTVYREQEEYRKALEYYAKADSVIRLNHIDNLAYYTALNTGDAYNLLNIPDSAFSFFKKSLEIALVQKDGDFIGTSMTGLGHCYLKMDNTKDALSNYKGALDYLRAANDDEILCEAALGLAKLYKQRHYYDSAGYYASLSLTVAQKDGFLSKELEAAEFLTDHFKKTKNIDSAFTYVSYVKTLNDSVNSKTKIRESQVISSNEHFRQLEREAEQEKEKSERAQQLQMLLIAIFIPGLFLLTLLLSRVNIHARLIRVLGVLSLLFFFEYLTLLLHPTVASLTHHTPVYEILIFVAMGAVLIPLHHRLEHWLIHKLVHHKQQVKLKTSKTPE